MLTGILLKISLVVLMLKTLHSGHEVTLSRLEATFCNCLRIQFSCDVHAVSVFIEERSVAFLIASFVNAPLIHSLIFLPILSILSIDITLRKAAGSGSWG